jgi:hypothetical protein
MKPVACSLQPEACLNFLASQKKSITFAHHNLLAVFSDTDQEKEG